jgi:hypothetical protein
MKSTVRLIAASVLALGLTGSVAATADFGPFRLQIAPNSFEERCVKLVAGQSLRYRFKASTPLDFNIHYHRGNDVFYPVRKAAVAARTGRFRAKSPDTYCLMWENRGKSVAVIEGVLENVAVR